jgi:hypothetical protein
MALDERNLHGDKHPCSPSEPDCPAQGVGSALRLEPMPSQKGTISTMELSPY